MLNYLMSYCFMAIQNDKTRQGENEDSGEATTSDATSFGVDLEALMSSSKNKNRLSQNRYSFMQLSTPKLKPALNEEEKLLLGKLLKALHLNFDEFSLKLKDLKLSPLMFLRKIKQEMMMFRLPDPKQEDIFLQALINRQLIPEALLEKLKKKPLPQLEQENNRRFHPTPFSTKLTPFKRF